MAQSPCLPDDQSRRLTGRPRRARKGWRPHKGAGFFEMTPVADAPTIAKPIGPAIQPVSISRRQVRRGSPRGFGGDASNPLKLRFPYRANHASRSNQNWSKPMEGWPECHSAFCRNRQYALHSCSDLILSPRTNLRAFLKGRQGPRRNPLFPNQSLRQIHPFRGLSLSFCTKQRASLKGRQETRKGR